MNSRLWMKRSLPIIALISSTPVWAGDCATDVLKQTFRPTLTARADPQSFNYKPVHPTCCAGHGGACGCFHTSGHVRCCDGFQSPSCKCEKKDD